jgi:hypothetical protein
MYILYSIARNNSVETCVTTHNNEGKYISGEKTSTIEAKDTIEKIRKNKTLTLIQLPIDADSDFYDKYILMEN